MERSKKYTARRILAFILCAALLCGGLFIPVLADEAAESRKPSRGRQILYDIGDTLLVGFLKGIAAVMPIKLPKTYETGLDFYLGMEAFLDEPAEGARWSLGYARASVIPGGWFDPVTKEYIGPEGVFVGGSPKGEDPLRPIIDDKVPTRLIDDMCVRVTALSDGSGRGAAVFAQLDTYAITSYDIRIIRAWLREFAEENNLVSINIGMLHQHSSIDTFGYNGPLLKSLFLNPFINLLPEKWRRPLYTGKSPAYMEFLYEVMAEAVMEAVGNMEPGALYYGSASAEEWIYDRRPPYIMDEEMHRLRFVPDKEDARETWMLNLGVHHVGLDGDSQRISGDAPYYAEERVNEIYDANFQLIVGGQLGIHKRYTPIEDGTERGQIETMMAWGYALADYIAGVDNEEEVEPLLNIRHAEYRVPVDNPLHLLILRSGATQFTAVKRRFGPTRLDIVTETGYMELGGSLAVGFGPGEIDPILYLGGASPAAESYTGKDYPFTPMKDMARGDAATGGSRKFLMFSLMNDRSLYYLLPNDFQNFVRFGNEEINCMSALAGPRLLEAFEALTDSVK